MGEGKRRITYADYLHLHDLINLQDGAGDRKISSDEHHFIIVHQAFELWFCRILFEMREIKKLLAQRPVPEDDIPRIVHKLERVTEIFNLFQGQWKVMQTLTPQGFLNFRDELGTASGFESFQLRELEIMLGIDFTDRPGGMNPLEHFARLADESESSRAAYQRLVKVSEETSIREELRTWLSRTPIQGSSPDDDSDEEVVQNFVEEHLATTSKMHESALQHFTDIGQEDIEKIGARFSASLEGIREFLLPDGRVDRARAGLLFIESYRELPLLAWPRALVDSVVEMEQSMLLFRTHHARMVERMIGRRVGTGGSSGVDYLDATTKMRIFPDLWAVRTILLKRDELPPVKQPEAYGFREK